MPLRIIMRPVNSLIGAFLAPIGNTADARMVKYQNSDWKPTLERAAVTYVLFCFGCPFCLFGHIAQPSPMLSHRGEDLSNTAYGRFVVQSLLTFPGRFATLSKELGQIPTAAAVWQWDLADFITFFQFFARLAAIYLAFKMVGREQMLTLVGPDSIFFNADEKIEV